MNRELKESFLTAVENAVTQCLMEVPVHPLIELGEAVAQTFDEIDAEACVLNADGRLLDVWEAASEVEWSLFPEDDDHPSQALVNNATLLVLANALRSYREAEAEAVITDDPLSAPHWEAVTPMGVNP